MNCQQCADKDNEIRDLQCDVARLTREVEIRDRAMTPPQKERWRRIVADVGESAEMLLSGTEPR